MDDLESIRLSEIRQTPKTNTVQSHFCRIKKKKTYKIERMVVARWGQGYGKRVKMVKGTNFQF